MKLTSIRWSNVAGSSGTEALAPITVFLGPNFSHKTTRANVVRLILLGYIPALGKRNQDTFRLCNAREMWVEGDTDTGLTIRREWKLKGDSVNRQDTVPETIKDAIMPLAVLLDPNEYFGLTDRERIEYVASHQTLGEEFTREAIMARVKKAAGVEDRFPIVITVQPTIQSFMGNTIEAFVHWQKAAKETADRMQKTIQGLAHLQAMDAEQIGQNITGLDNQMTVLRAEIDQLNNDKGALMGQYEAGKTSAKRRAEIGRTLTTEGQKRARLLGVQQRLDELSGIINRTEDRNFLVEATDLEKQLADVRSVGDGLSKKSDEHGQSIAKFKAELVKLTTATECPYCKACGEGWKVGLASTLERATRKLNEEVPQVTTDLEAARKQYEVLLQKRKDLRAELEGRTNAANERITLTSEKNTLENHLHLMDQMRTELANLPEEDAEITAKVDTIQTQLNIKNEESRKLDQSRKAAMQQQGERQRLGEAEVNRDKAIKDQTTAKAAEKELRVIQAEMVEAAFRPILETANRIFGDMLPSPLAYHDGEIGRWDAGSFVTNKTMSGAEQVMTFTAIAAAISQQAPVRCIITDELFKVGESNLPRFFEQLLTATDAGQIDMVIGTEPEDRLPSYRELETRLHDIKVVELT